MWISGPAKRVSSAGRTGTLRPGFHLAPGMRVGLFGRGGVLSGESVYTVRARVTQVDPNVAR